MDKKIIDFNTKYISKISFDDYSSVNDILISYYIPLIRSDAFSLYSSLIIDARNNMINSVFISIERIISMINLSMDKIKLAISRLEIVGLLDVFTDGDNKVIFNLKKPLSPEEFNNSPQMLELFKSSVGISNLEINNKLFYSLKNNELNGFKLKTQEVNLFTRKNSKKGKLNINYDFDSIQNILSSKYIKWKQYWNNELEEIILNLIVIYRISTFDIALELIKEMKKSNFSTSNFMKRMKINYVKNKEVDSIIDYGIITTKVKLDFLSEMLVKDYFIHKLNRNMTTTEESMVKDLHSKYGFNDFQINILIDYSIIVNNGAINKNYIFKISDTALKENINSPEKLIQYLKTSYKMKLNNKTKLSLNKNIEMEDKPIF